MKPKKTKLKNKFAVALAAFVAQSYFTASFAEAQSGDPTPTPSPTLTPTPSPTSPPTLTATPTTTTPTNTPSQPTVTTTVTIQPTISTLPVTSSIDTNLHLFIGLCVLFAGMSILTLNTYKNSK